MSESFLQKSPILVMLSLIALAIFLYLKKMTTSNLIAGNDIYDKLRAAGLNDVLSAFALSQFAHETNGFTSSIFKSNNNVCGMTYAQQSLAQDEKNGYAYYNTIDDSVQDFVKWYSRHRNKLFSLPLTINSLEDYVSFLKNQDYFTADESEYLKGCQFFYNQLFK
jgi:hypothetical protein